MNLKKYKRKAYTHFDDRVSIHKVAKDIQNPCWVKKHGFFPFIYFDLKFIKYNEHKGEVVKSRKICYSSHVDSYIYKYYGEKLNHEYNKELQSRDLNNVATAYRNNLDGQSNIHF